MIRLLYMLMFILLIAGLAIIAFKLLMEYISNASPNSNKIRKDLDTIKKELKPWVKDLVPFEKDEVETLSYNQINKVAKKGVVTTVKGVFTSIYHEPLIAYSYKKYLGQKDNAILYAKTSKHEFFYWQRGDEIRITINKEAIGILKENGVLYSARNQKLIARIDKNELDLVHPILVNNRELASLVNIRNQDPQAMKVNPRAFQILETMNEEEEKLMLALAILEMTRKDGLFNE